MVDTARMRDIPPILGGSSPLGSSGSADRAGHVSGKSMGHALSREDVLTAANQLFPHCSYTSSSVSLKGSYALLRGNPEAMLFFRKSGEDYRIRASHSRTLLADIGIPVGKMFESDGAIGFSYVFHYGGDS